MRDDDICVKFQLFSADALSLIIKTYSFKYISVSPLFREIDFWFLLHKLKPEYIHDFPIDLEPK